MSRAPGTRAAPTTSPRLPPRWTSADCRNVLVCIASRNVSEHQLPIRALSMRAYGRGPRGALNIRLAPTLRCEGGGLDCREVPVIARYILAPPHSISVGGLRTPAPVCAAPPSWGRHPQTFTSADVIASEFTSPGLGAAPVEVLRSIRPPRPSNHPVSKRNANLPGVGNWTPKIADTPSRRNDVGIGVCVGGGQSQTVRSQASRRRSVGAG
jgi:hypothetical protein